MWCWSRVFPHPTRHTDTLTGSVWAVVSVQLWVSSGKQSHCEVIELRFMWFVSGTIQTLRLYFRHKLTGHLEMCVCARVWMCVWWDMGVYGFT